LPFDRRPRTYDPLSTANVSTNLREELDIVEAMLEVVRVQLRGQIIVLQTESAQGPRESSQTNPFKVRLGASEFLGNSFTIGNHRLNIQILGSHAGAQSL
jgi:hypothetical protein